MATIAIKVPAHLKSTKKQTPGTIKEQVRVLAENLGMLKGQRDVLRAKCDPSRLEQKKASLDRQIAELVAAKGLLDAEAAEAPAKLALVEEQVKACQRRIVRLRCGADIERLMRLQAQTRQLAAANVEEGGEPCDSAES